MNIRLNVFGQSALGHKRRHVAYTAVTGRSGVVYVAGNLAGGIEEVGRHGVRATILRGPARPRAEIVCRNGFRAIRQIVEHFRSV
jgi:hypothetical protein